MSIYLEFPSIEDYPVFTPEEQVCNVIPDWLKGPTASSLVKKRG